MIALVECRLQVVQHLWGELRYPTEGRSNVILDFLPGVRPTEVHRHGHANLCRSGRVNRESSENPIRYSKRIAITAWNSLEPTHEAARVLSQPHGERETMLT